MESKEGRTHEREEFTEESNKDQHKDKDKDKAVIVTVNEQPVRLHGDDATGAEIKTAAIAQGVQIQQNFVLQEELPNGTSRIVGDNDIVKLRAHLRFTALAPDDNS
jgi:hypothetical protein